MTYPDPAKMSSGELAFAQQLKDAGISFMYDQPFAQSIGRKWKFDFLLSGRIVFEIEGGVWSRGRHTRGKGFLDDLEKYNTATMMGYHVFRVSTEQAETGKALALAREALKLWANNSQASR